MAPNSTLSRRIVARRCSTDPMGASRMPGASCEGGARDGTAATRRSPDATAEPAHDGAQLGALALGEADELQAERAGAPVLGGRDALHLGAERARAEELPGVEREAQDVAHLHARR